MVSIRFQKVLSNYIMGGTFQTAKLTKTNQLTLKLSESYKV
jgi:hypothetical protein